MGGHVRINASEIPFYISLAQDGMKNHHEFGNVRNLNKTGYVYYAIYCMLVKAKDRDIYIDVDSFNLLEKENR